MASGVAYGSLPFKEQIAFFRGKQNVLTDAWTDVWEAEHDHAFMVAGANRIDLVTDLRGAVDRAIADGTGLEAFRRDFDQIVAKHGWAYNGGRNWRTRVIFETNMRTSYAAGRYAQLQALKRVRPFWRYRHSDAVVHPRPQHQAWDGLVLHADDPWWNTHYPPNGWGCQCTVEGLNARDLARLGKGGPDTAPPDDMQQLVVGKNGPHPRLVETPAGVDPGFGYAPGKSAYERGNAPPAKRPPALPPGGRAAPGAMAAKRLLADPFARLTQDTLAKATRLPALAGAELLAELLARPRVREALDQTFSGLQLLLIGTALLGATEQPPDDVVMGALDPELVRALADAGTVPASAPIIATASAAGGTPLQDAPAVLREARAVLLDPATGQLLYVDSGADVDGAVRVVWIQPATAAQAANTLAGDGRANLTELQLRIDAGELTLLRGYL